MSSAVQGNIDFSAKSPQVSKITDYKYKMNKAKVSHNKINISTLSKFVQSIHAFLLVCLKISYFHRIFISCRKNNVHIKMLYFTQLFLMDFLLVFSLFSKASNHQLK